MKKITKIIGLMSMAAVVAFSASSCKKTEEGASFNIGFGQVQGFETGERAYIDLDDLKFRWSEGDAIMVYNLANDYTESVARVFVADAGAEGKELTTFHGSAVGERKDIGYFYFYPAEKASGSLQADNRETFNVGDYQEYDENVLFDPSSLVMACDVNDLQDDVTMQHIFGFLNLRVRLSASLAAQLNNAHQKRHVTSITVEDNAYDLTGEVSMKLPAVNATTFSNLYDQCVANDPNFAANLGNYLNNELGYESNPDGNTIELDCANTYDGEGVQIGGQRKFFIMSLRPGALRGGFTVTINFLEEDVEPCVVEVPADLANCIRPGWFTNIDIQVNE